MASDDKTPADLRREVLRARREREEAIRKELELPPEYDSEEEDSKVTLRLEGEAAEIFARQGGLLARVKASIPPISERMSSPKGKLAALITLIVSALVAAVAKRYGFGP